MPRVLALAALFAGLSAAIAGAADVTARRTLPSGTVLADTDLGIAEGEAAALRDGMIGLETRRVIYAGRPVNPADLGPPTLVRRNDVVTMRFLRSGLEIRAEGRALEAGGAGERIQVLNLESRQSVVARVTAPALVEIRR
ncbi:MAG: flagellar basal body P-ring formation chaperone FlgA [Thermohalobaculum sp.]|nr:flagellar basal body P-ring formation chaperone FlgA [Thermohalobaculum sp.]